MTKQSVRCARLQQHLEALTVTIGERSLAVPQNLHRTADYIQSTYRDLGLTVYREPVPHQNREFHNIIAETPFWSGASHRYILGAHYDSVAGTLGADDNASGVAVQLETARSLQDPVGAIDPGLAVRFVSFALEEPPVYGTSRMGSRVHLKGIRERREKLHGMICLEMVGYTCFMPGCQSYPFPLGLRRYPKEGTFIGLVGNFRSRHFTRALWRSFADNPALPAIKLTVPGNGWLIPAVRLSDHAPFWDHRYNAVMVTDSAFFRNPHYHQPSDTMETLDFGFMAELVRSLQIFFQPHDL